MNISIHSMNCIDTVMTPHDHPRAASRALGGLMRLSALALLGLLQVGAPALAQPPLPVPPPIPGILTFHEGRLRHRPHGDNDVGVARNVDLPAGQTADSVVAVLGSASVEGEARANVVAIGGSARVSGPVGGNAVSVLGSTYVNSHVGGNAVAVLGTLELGPNAEIDGDVQAVGGELRRDPGAIVHGTVQDVGPGVSIDLGWINPWVRHALLYLRPLALGPGLGWAWSVAGVFLALYLLLAFVAPRGIERCVQSLELHPGPTLLAAILTVLLTPPLLLLLVVTVIGIAAVPVVVLALFCASLFGKAAALAWLGSRFLRRRLVGEPLALVLAVLIGGIIMLALYLVPVLGLVAYKLLGLLGLGMVVHALILAGRARRAVPPAGVHPGTPGVPPPAPSTPAAAAASGTGAAAASEPLSPGPDSAGAAPAAALSRTPVDPAQPRAGFWIRMLALLLDAIVVGIVMGLLHWRHLMLLALACYGAILWKARGTTIGGIVFDLHVVRVDGRPIDWTTAIVRALGCFLSLAIVGLGFIWIAFDENRQAWHDKFAGTLVVRVAKAASPVQA